ncbi:MAG: beta-ribofuranosylaminobenzene 5'-phosphate synthase [Methanosarcinales archaeon]|nr:MAG: beta-ribofuranosylaminobenzene 5'-phosphate synthase [Methanosarcinales archaeon]
MLRITTPSRLHIALIDLNGALGRIDGGIGLALDTPSIILSAEKADEIIVEGNNALQARVKKSAEAVARGHGGVHIVIEEGYPSHVGLGSGTQASLAAGMAVNALYNLELSVQDIARIVQRGGTSGIGVAAFEKGGFILDGGHRFDEKGGFEPSSVSRAPPPPVLMRHDFPNWDIVLALPALKGAFSTKEVNIFQEECPIPLAEVQATSHIILMGLLPALLEGDLEAFGSAINTLQDTGFKKREVKHQPIARALMGVMLESGAAGAGMSSFGPLIYGITDSPHEVQEAVKDYMGDKGNVMLSRARNTGAHIQYQ